MFAYCGNNPIMCFDPYGTRAFAIGPNIDACVLDNLGYGSRSVPYYGPYMRKVDTVQEAFEAISEFAVDVYNSDLIQAGTSLGKAKKGTNQLIAGVAVLVAPDPVPLVDEILAITKIGIGLWNTLVGFFKALDSIIE